MGSHPSTPHNPHLIALNSSGSFAKHNNILLPPEAFLPPYPPQRRKSGGDKYAKDHQAYDRWPRGSPERERRWKGGGGDGRYGRGGRGGRGYVNGGGVPVVQVPVAMPYFEGRGGKGMAGKGVKPVIIQPQQHPGVMPVGLPPGVPGPIGGIPYAYPYPPPAAIPHLQPHIQAQPPPPPPPHPLQTHHPIPHHQKQFSNLDDIPYGAHTAPQPPKPSRKRPEPQVSRHLNRTQGPHNCAGPSGHEWLEGENPWLDACTCTTNCRCRKGVRVLYRAEGGGGEEGRRFGEIRYVVKGELGRDCGERRHGGGGGSSEEGSSDGGRGRGKKEKERKKEKKKKKGGASSEHGSDVSKMRAEMAGLRNDIANMRLGGGMPTGATPMMGPSTGGMPPFDPRFEFGALPGNMLSPSGLPSPMNGIDPRLDPHIVQMRNLDPFAMDVPPHRSMPQRRTRNPNRRLGPGRGPRLGGPGESDVDFSDPSSDPFIPMGRLQDGIPQHVSRPLRRGLQKPRRSRHAKHIPFAQRPGSKFDPQGYAPQSPQRRHRNVHAPNAHTAYGFDHNGSPPRHFGAPDMLDVLDEEDEEEEDWLQGTRPRAAQAHDHPNASPPHPSPPRGRPPSTTRPMPTGDEARRPNQAHVEEDFGDA